MGEHDQTVLHDEDAHQSIHDDGRTLRQGGLVYNPGYPVAVPEPGAKQVFIYRGKKLIPDTVYIHSDAFLVTKWESMYSSVFTPGDSNFSRASFAPIIDDHWRVIGHLGWADGNDILVPEETVRNDRHFWSILQKVRLGEERQQILDEAFLRDRRRPFPNFPFPPPTTSPPPLKDGKRWRGPENCVPRPPTRYRPTREEQARSGPLKEEETDQYLHDLDCFVNGGENAFVGRHFLKPGFASYLDPYPGLPDGEVGSPKKPFSSGYEFLVLVDPDGNLQGVMEIRKNLTTQHERDLEIILGLVDLTMTILMVIDIAPIAVLLFRLAGKMATRATIWAIKLVANREAKALLKEVEILTEAELKAIRGGMPTPATRPRLISPEELNKPVPQVKSITGPKRKLERPERIGATKVLGVLENVRSGSAKTAAEIQAEIERLLPGHRVKPLDRDLAGWTEIDLLEGNPGAVNNMRIIYRVKNGEWEVKLRQMHGGNFKG